jgi:DnaJ domain
MGRPSGGSGFELVLIAIAAGALAVVFVVPYALAILLYALPLFVLWLSIPVQVGAEPQLIIDSSPHSQLAELRAQKRYAVEQREHVRYSDWGIRWSDNLGRFEERSVRGQDLNHQLQHWGTESNRISFEIREIEGPETRAFMEWNKELRAWHQQHALNAAKLAGRKQVLLVFFGVWIAAELIGPAYPNFIRLFAFVWNPAPNYLHPGIAIGAAAGWAAGIYRLCHPPRLFDERASTQIREYLAAKRAREEIEDSRTAYSSKGKSFDEEEDDHEETEEPDSPWYAVLSVDPKSTIDEIKAAYKRAAMACHPDKVAHMNEHIQQVAKEEMQKLNDAFQKARTVRGFS